MPTTSERNPMSLQKSPEVPPETSGTTNGSWSNFLFLILPVAFWIPSTSRELSQMTKRIRMPRKKLSSEQAKDTQ